MSDRPVISNDIEMDADWAAKIEAAQSVNTIELPFSIGRAG